MYCIDKLLKGEKPQLTKCEQPWDYLHCRDAAKAFYLIGKHGQNQKIYHIGSGKASPLSKYVYAIRDAIDPKLPLGIGEKAYDNKQVMHLCADISSLRNDTGFSPNISFKDGILDTIRWYKQTNRACLVSLTDGF
jgi:nucleoside-diphosphate-sugar epimerase